MKHIVVLLLCFVGNQAVASELTIRLNVTGQAPLNTQDQKGFMDEVATEAFRRINIELQTDRLPAERALKNANNGIIDGEMSRIEGLDKIYSNLIRVPEKIMDWEFVAFSYNPIDLDKGWRSLSEESVAYINGWKIIEKNIPSSTEAIKVSNATDLFKLLSKNRTDHVIYERWGGRYLLNKIFMNDVELSKPPLAIKEMFIYLHNKHKALVPKLSAALASMKKDGGYQRLVRKHLSPFK